MNFSATAPCLCLATAALVSCHREDSSSLSEKEKVWILTREMASAGKLPRNADEVRWSLMTREEQHHFRQKELEVDLAREVEKVREYVARRRSEIETEREAGKPIVPMSDLLYRIKQVRHADLRDSLTSAIQRISDLTHEDPKTVESRLCAGLIADMESLAIRDALEVRRNQRADSANLEPVEDPTK